MRKKLVSTILIGAMLVGNMTAYAKESTGPELATDTDAPIAVETPVDEDTTEENTGYLPDKGTK